MDGVEPIEENEGLADVFLWGQPHRVTHAPAYFRLKHLAAWFVLTGQAKPITLHVWDDWDSLGERLSIRWDRYLWHPSHWDVYYATLPDRPASSPGAVPTSITKRKEQQELFAEVS